MKNIKYITLIIQLLIMFAPLPTSGSSTSVQIKEELNIQGTWKCVYSVYDDPMANEDEMPPYNLHTPNTIVFEDDSAFVFNYPCELVSKHQITLVGDTLFSTDASNNLEHVHIEIANDTLIMTSGSFEEYYIEKRYVRHKREALQLNKLKQNSIDSKYLIGKWNLELTYYTGYDGWGLVKYDFPFRVAKKIDITESNLSKLFSVKNKTLLININGKEEPFYIEKMMPCDGRLELHRMNLNVKKNKSKSYPLYFQKETLDH